MGVKRTIEADKAGIIEHLEAEEQQSSRHAMDTTRTRRERDRAAGRRDGLEFAIRVLRDWQEPT